MSSEPRSVLSGVTRGARLLGIALIAFGAIAALAPALAGAPVVVLVGLVLVLAGAVRAVFGWRAWSAGKGPLGIVVGLLALACGLALVVNPVSTLGTVSSLVAVYLVVDGVVGLFFSGRLEDREGRAWMGGEALLSILLGVSMWVGWPLSGLRALGILVGTKLASAGVVLLRVERGLERASAGLAAIRARLDA
jgi:uncharacterized membrane protein HdeD (DUF308 family)